MKIADANIVLRYLLNDTEELAKKATEILENNEVYIPNEIIAEIVYVLEKVYKVKNDEISNTLKNLFQYGNLKVIDLDVVEEALDIYGKKKFDFVDTLLYAYYKIKGYEIYTFDKKLNKLLKK
ncbi:MAG: type II toxin-antitoxin system VapC family toxin [Tissierellaceae bacterium]|jgi:predicted nucleic-acid-binding protein|nr:type II toxin-antitoxin system VapC family toxin [Tissierellaceae bacterium]